MKTILFRGYSGSGKTWALTQTARALVKAKRGKIGTIKGIHDRSFTIDSKGKDTWLHAASGASIVAAFAPKEVDIIRKENASKTSLEAILGTYRESHVDYLLVEGLHKRMRNLGQVYEIICARNEAEAKKLARVSRHRLLFITGRFARNSRRARIAGVPVLSLPRDNAQALDLVVGAQWRPLSPRWSPVGVIGKSSAAPHLRNEPQLHSIRKMAA